jgi:hypothetical protein
MMRYLWIIVCFTSGAVLSQAGCVGCALGPQPEPPDVASSAGDPTDAEGNANTGREDDDQGGGAGYSADAGVPCPPSAGEWMDGAGGAVVWPYDPRDVWQAQGADGDSDADVDCSDGGVECGDGGVGCGDGGIDCGNDQPAELEGDVDGAVDGGDAMPQWD